MIYGNIHDEEACALLPPMLQRALAYARTHDLGSFPEGRQEIKGDDLYVNIAHYTTGIRAEKIWEAHRIYADVHVLAAGTERIDVSAIERMEMGDYDPARDFIPAAGEVDASVVMHPGDFLVCLPSDVHRSGVMVDRPAPLKKGIFKVRMSCIERRS